ncbi:RNA pseudouridine synthase [bacterium (Candidatus Blackallbacteria) CG17_big_fil_post_rev_8_21_14_2_50_48_46]|uniref:Pseudouridine synthase n=1 Tax=bacterium (Candidatus Blackallbacteria) CG17_big_fil_post_rev_8_21_14_2_50_48_46 TaxID=2014261 RepID=A0A2M7G8N2_9BACT|nr:MAG: RNA pseudouridine synthase [bacterium (Candidatus Blackallbacteria) CG18_big_fil_WC_8_21_14_2_50_49_26]PIW18457.1 MAG: RNA pseudouridine synthase [bacterium (Candidatus Blackallbacteria) CG17_big_fil_post_rev_8_21_14_2_50_48_46]PIW46558.1 MAG: RNA pseudouridine synthase [bacterium (Candidatus Blackallbacteria) CG13_big_fil_rev_8_21_14_2_50_49_14]
MQDWEYDEDWAEDDEPELLPDEPAAVELARLQFEIPHFSQRTRIDSFLTRHLRYATRNRIQKAIAEGRVTVNGKNVKNSCPLHRGDLVEITLKRPAATDMVAQEIPLDILYEDEDLIVLNKPPGIAVHPTYQHWDGTLANGLLWHYRQQVGDMSAPFKPGLIHRLDKNTSGVLVVGKTLLAKRKLSRQFEERLTGKIYWALVWGVPRHQKGILETNLGVSKKNRMQIDVFPLHGPDGKPAKTGWEVLEKAGGFSLLRVVLFTGRTHQIRSHLRHLGHPIVGDATYGGLHGEGFDYPEKDTWLPQLQAIISRQALHAGHLEVNHPATGQRMAFQAPLPADILAALEWLRQFTQAQPE